MIAEAPFIKESIDGTETFCLFWGQASPFSSWRASSFEIDGIQYSSGEQRMMHCKAAMFGDEIAAAAIMGTPSPWRQKAIGRTVAGYDEEVWARERFSMMVEVVYYKAMQDEEIKAYLLSTGDSVIVEASPEDPVWGIGMRADDPRAIDRSKWQGDNLLGEAWTVAREMILNNIEPNPTNAANAVLDLLDAIEARQAAKLKSSM